MSSSQIEAGKNRRRNSRSGGTAEQNSSTDWLPPGWTAQVRVRKSGKKDTCYTDLSSGVKLFSKPEVFRYINNMETKRSRSNGKRKGSRSRKLSAINSPPVAGQLNFADSRPNEVTTTNQSSKAVGVLKDNQNLETHTGGKRATMICFTLPQATDSEQRENTLPIATNSKQRENTLQKATDSKQRENTLPKATDSKQREKSDPSVTVGPLPKNLTEIGVENSGNKRLQLRVSEKNNREKPDLPRRASKRLAGIEVGPIAELKTNNRTHRVSARRLDEAQTSKADSAAPEEFVEKRTAVDNGDNKKADKERGGSPLNFSLKDLWTDPCIEFAIKTLMDATPTEDENQAEENPVSSVELPFGDSWGDPCIDFAVKTLTGAIPVVDDLGVPDCLLTSSSETKQDKSSEISNSGLHYSGDSGIHPHCEERSDEHQRKTIHW